MDYIWNRTLIIMAATHQVFFNARRRIDVVLSTNTQEYTLTASSLSGYQHGASDIVLTVDTGIYVYSDNTANPALTATGFNSGDTFRIINKGYIIGKGGRGSSNTSVSAMNAGAAGGPAISINHNAIIDNTDASAYIAGGGGGGGGGIGSFTFSGTTYYIGGGGGGAGGGVGGTSAGGAAGGVGAAGSNGTTSGTIYGGGGGGRILPGTGGASVTVSAAGGNGGGSGGSGGQYSAGSPFGSSGDGGDGSSAGGNGTNGSNWWGKGGGGGGWGALGGNGIGSQAGATSGGSGGKAVNLNGNSVTWVSSDTTRVYGAVS